MSDQLPASEDDVSRLVAQVVDYAIIGLDASGVIRSWNSGAERLKGYDRQEALGQSFTIFYRDADRRAGLPLRLLELARTEGTSRHQGWRVRRDGSRFWADVVITAVHDEAGVVDGFVKITRDLTQEHELHLALQHSEQRLRLLIDRVSDYAIIALDPSGVIESWNSGAQRLKGYEATEAIGQSLSIFYTDGDRRAGLPLQLLETARSEGQVRHLGWRVRKDGTRFWGDVLITAIRDDAGQLTGFAKVTRDMTEQHRLQEARESFLATLAHDFKTPLTAVTGFLEFAADGAEGDQRIWLDRAQHNVSRLETMLDDFAAFISIDTTGPALPPAGLDLTALCRRTVLDLASVADVSRIVLPEHPVMCLADHGAMSRVVTNLVTNALKYSTEGPVVVDVAAVGARVRLSVADHGRGIHPEDLPRIFDARERGRFATDDGGSGVGLSSVKDLVTRQGGRVWINSVVGQGSVVIVDLPGVSEADVPGDRTVTA